MSAPAADRAEIGRFVEALFRHADEGGYVSLRTFGHERGKPPVEIRAVRLNGEGLAPVVAQATGAATRAARHPEPTVFAPILCTFDNGQRAAEADVRNGLALSSECDEHPAAAGRRLEALLGPATVVVASGGEWTDPATGEVQSKLHLHWRLSEPTCTSQEHTRLKRARRLAAALAGGDPSAVPLVHPLRWPGSWHRKGQPRLCRILELRDDAEIDVGEALERLEQAAALALEHATGEEARRLRLALELQDRAQAEGAEGGAAAYDPEARDPDLEALAEAIPNEDAPRAEYVAVGLGFHAASDGSAAGFNAWDRWARKSTKYHGGTAKQWAHFARSPPDRTGKGALVERARRADPTFRLPSWGPEPEAGSAAREQASGSHGQAWPARLAPEAFHGLAGEIVRTIEPESEADPAALLFQFLAAAGNILGARAYVQVEGDRHPPRLFVVQVGRTSKGRKGTSWGRIRSLLETVAPVWAKDRVASGLSSGEGLIHAVRDPVSRPEAGKKTGQAHEVVADQGVADKRLLVFEGEFAKALRSMERQGNTLSAVLRDAWDHGDLRTLVKNDPNRATGAHVSLVGHITADELRRYLDRTEIANGLANRLIFVCVQRSKLLPRGGRTIDWSGVERRLREILAGAPNGEIGRTDAAWEIWEAVYPELSADRPGLLGAVLGRAEAQVLRLALVYALLDRSAFIDAPHLLAALACWDHAEASARFVFGDALGDPVADEILRALRERRGGMTRTELMHHFGRNVGSEQIGRALAVLARGHFVTSETIRTGGRPAERWRASR